MDIYYLPSFLSVNIPGLIAVPSEHLPKGVMLELENGAIVCGQDGTSSVSGGRKGDATRCYTSIGVEPGVWGGGEMGKLPWLRFL